jgi:CTP:molybdopterin cytidylyltransferase MocA
MKKEKIKYKHASALVLAAGYSLRLGRPKLSLLFNESTTFLEQIIDQYKTFGCIDIVVVLNQEGIEIVNNEIKYINNSVLAVKNDFPELARFFSIKVGLKACNSNYPVFIHNIDNPYAETKMLQDLLLKLNNSDYSYPVYKGKGGHPVLVSPKVMQSLLNEPANELNLKVFLNQFKKSTLEVEDQRVILNINTQYDYEIFFRHLQ